MNNTEEFIFLNIWFIFALVIVITALKKNWAEKNFERLENTLLGKFLFPPPINKKETYLFYQKILTWFCLGLLIVFYLVISWNLLFKST
jgi:hypothetical protein